MLIFIALINLLYFESLVINYPLLIRIICFGFWFIFTWHFVKGLCVLQYRVCCEHVDVT